MAEVFSFEVLLQWSEEVEVLGWAKVRMYGGSARHFVKKLLQDLHCDMDSVEVDIVMKDQFLCEQVREFHFDDFL
jgi:hypothetical protein